MNGNKVINVESKRICDISDNLYIYESILEGKKAIYYKQKTDESLKSKKSEQRIY